jgi:hypothetical protein
MKNVIIELENFEQLKALAQFVERLCDFVSYEKFSKINSAICEAFSNHRLFIILKKSEFKNLLLQIQNHEI